MPEYIVMMRYPKSGDRAMNRWRRANDYEFTKKSLAETERDMLREEFPDWEFAIATIEPEE